MTRWPVALGTICAFLLVLSGISIPTPPATSGGIKHDSPTACPVYSDEFVNHNPIEIIGNDDLAIQNWPGNGTWDDPYRIENLNITTSNSTAIRIVNVTVHFVILRCLLVAVGDNHDSMIELERVSNGRIEECTIIDANVGALISSSRNSSFSRNTVINCWHGVFVSGGRNISIFLNDITRSRGSGVILDGIMECEILNNSFSDSIDGIEVSGASNTTIAGNEFTNDSNGIVCALTGPMRLLIHDNRFLNVSGAGIGVTSIEGTYAASDPKDEPPPIYTVISSNLFSDSLYGFTAEFGAPVLFTGNHIERCSVGDTVFDFLRYGVWLDNAHLNTIFGNTISGSGIGNALDDGGFNIWDNGIDTGNTWSDYNGGGLYEISGSANSVDRWPERVGPPFLWVENETEIIEGTSGQELTWKAYDADPLTYEIKENGTIIESGPWDGRNITISLDGLEVGTYNFTATVTDLEGNSSTSVAIVCVLQGQNLWLPISVVIAAICLSAVAVALRKRE
jgi:parallel beta-helix repeat protein